MLAGGSRGPGGGQEGKEGKEGGWKVHLAQDSKHLPPADRRQRPSRHHYNPFFALLYFKPTSLECSVINTHFMRGFGNIIVMAELLSLVLDVTL